MNDKTLSKLYERLSAGERAVMMLRLWKEDEREPHLLDGMSSAQGREYNRYADLVNGLHDRLPPLVLVLHASTENLSLRVGWYLSLISGVMDIERIGDDIAAMMSERPERDLKLARALARTVQNYLWAGAGSAARGASKSRQTLMETLPQIIKDGVIATGAQLAAADLIVKRVAEDFGGEDPLHPVVREGLEKVRSDLQDVRASLALKSVDWPPTKPDEKLLRALTDSVLRGADVGLIAADDE